eukprot:TRINITY_DN814_c0_g1_i12.p1 TRINITY_DN814_c0_g1~~TRINITY_DN814_c0_g1_i12.p1  ORF type:complete len:437 (+),score=84.96 TRINITY_DN814_c0_g1_i12:188-1498(+)
MRKLQRIKSKIRDGHKHIRLTDTGLAGVELEVTPFSVFTRDAVLETSRGEKVAPPEMVSMHGKVAGDEGSFVTLHLSEHGSYGTVQSRERMWQIGVPVDKSCHSELMEITPSSLEDEIAKRETLDSEITRPVQYHETRPSKKHKVLAQTRQTADNFDGTGASPVLTVAAECDKKCRDLFVTSGSCETPALLAQGPGRRLMGSWGKSPTKEPTQAPTNAPTSSGGGTTTSAGSSTAGCDHQAATYLASLIAGTSTIYTRDLGVNLQVKYMKIWGGASPYDGGTASLGAFKSAYSSVAGPIKDADIAHLYTGIYEGGLAYVSTACNNGGYNTGVSSIRGNWKGTLEANAYNWDLIVNSHEMGHNVGSGHTHDYTPAVDQCVDASGQAVSSGSAACVRGTIMSYCHLCGGVANVDMKLAPEVITKIKNNLKAGTCKLAL